MKVQLLADHPEHGKAKTELSGPDVWKLCFPMHGCIARPADQEAVDRVEQDLKTVGSGEERVRREMEERGSLQPTGNLKPRPAGSDSAGPVNMKSEEPAGTNPHRETKK